MRATVHATALMGIETSKAAMIVASGIHHAKVLARGLASQSRDGCTDESTTIRLQTT